MAAASSSSAAASSSSLSRRLSPLHLAAKTGQIGEIARLIRSGAEVDGRDLDGRTPLHWSVIHQQPLAIRALLELGATPLALTHQNETPLHLAISTGDIKLVVFLADTAPEALEIGDSDGKYPLHCAVWFTPKPDIVEFLLSRNALPNVQSRRRYTPLHWAAKHGHLNSARLLLFAGADPHITNLDGDAPIDLAMRWSQEPLVQLLQKSSKQSSYYVAEPKPRPLDTAPTPRGEEYQNFIRSCEEDSPSRQVYFLKRLAESALKEQNYQVASSLLAGALLISEENGFSAADQQMIASELDRIEALFLREKAGIHVAPKFRHRSSHYRKELWEIRQEAIEHLRGGRSAFFVCQRVTDRFKSLLGEIIEESIEMMETPPPTEWTAFGLGSMRSAEMSLRSDVEFGFLLKKNSEEIASYFRLLSRLIILRVMNLGETDFQPVRFEKNGKTHNLTPQGFSVDRLSLSPLGQSEIYELIGTPAQLARYQDPAWIKQNEQEVVSNALLDGCWICGDPLLLDAYRKEVADQLQERSINRGQVVMGYEARALSLLRGHLRNFQPPLTEDRVLDRTYDIKSDLLRPLQMMIAGVILHKRGGACSTKEGIEWLSSQRLISKRGARRLMQTLERALRLRLQGHASYGTEEEAFFLAEPGKEESTELFSTTKKDLLPQMFRTLLPLHRAMRQFVLDPKAPLIEHDFFDWTIQRPESPSGSLLPDDAHLAKVASLTPYDTTALGQLGTAKLELGEPAKALVYLREQQSRLKDPQKIQQNLSQMARAYHDLADYRRAIRLYKKAHRVCSDPLERAKLLVASGAAYCDYGKPKVALQLYKKAFPIYHQIGSDTDLADLLLHNTYARETTGETSENLQAYKRVLHCYSTGEARAHHSKRITVALRMAQASLAKGKRAAARRFAHHALSHCKKIYGSRDHPQTATAHLVMGQAYSKLGNFEEAGREYQEVLTICKKVYGSRPHPTVASALVEIGAIHIERKEYEPARELLLNALEVWGITIQTKNHLQVARAQALLGASLYKTSQVEAGRRALDQALPVYQEIHGPLCAFMLHHRGAIHLLMDEPSRALERLSSSLGMIRKRAQDALRYDTLFLLGRAHRELSHRREAAESYKAAFALYRAGLKRDAFHGVPYDHLMEAAEVASQFPPTFHLAARWLEWASEDPRFWNRKNEHLRMLADCYKELGVYEEARLLYNRLPGTRKEIALCKRLQLVSLADRLEEEALHGDYDPCQYLDKEAIHLLDKSVEIRKRLGWNPTDYEEVGDVLLSQLWEHRIGWRKLVGWTGIGNVTYLIFYMRAIMGSQSKRAIRDGRAPSEHTASQYALVGAAAVLSHKKEAK